MKKISFYEENEGICEVRGRRKKCFIMELK